MQKWEYLLVQSGERSDGYTDEIFPPRWVNGKELSNWRKLKWSEIANKFGEEGWELVSTHYNYYADRTVITLMIFKRPKPEG